LDSRCSGHITRDKNKFLGLEKIKNGGFVAFRDNRNALIKAIDLEEDLAQMPTKMSRTLF